MFESLNFLSYEWKDPLDIHVFVNSMSTIRPKIPWYFMKCFKKI